MQIAMLHSGDAARSSVGAKRARPDGVAAAPPAAAAAAAHIPRPSKVRAMLAMRACRSSIMIGTALTHARMRQIVSRLAGLDAPWNCPHGRPTMRHVCVLPARS
jgi:DNA mismatch repair ATPase MutL